MTYYLIDPFDLSDPTDYPAEMQRMRDEIERLRAPRIKREIEMDDRLTAAAKAIREEIVRQYRENDRAKCTAGVPFWEEEVQPMLLAEVAAKAFAAAE